MNNHIPTCPQGGIRRGPRQVDQFTIITNAVVNDRRLSFRARGVLIYLLSKPADWRTRSESIAAQSDKDGRDAVRSAMREMEAFGYLVRNRVQDDLGRWHMIQTIFENPLDTPGPEKSSTGGADVEESGALPRIDLQRAETNQPSRKAKAKPVVVDSPKIDKLNSEQLARVDELAAASQKAGLTATLRHLKPHNVRQSPRTSRHTASLRWLLMSRRCTIPSIRPGSRPDGSRCGTRCRAPLPRCRGRPADTADRPAGSMTTHL